MGKRTISNTSFNDQHSTKKPALTSPSTIAPPSPSGAHYLSALKSQYESRLLLAHQSYESLEDDYRKNVAQTERLKGERAELLEELDKHNSARQAEAEAWKQERQSLRDGNAELRDMATRLEEEVEDVRDEQARLRQEHQSSIVKLKSQVSQLTAEKDELLELAELEQQRRVSEATNLQQERQRVADLEASRIPPQDDAIVKQELHRILSHSKQLQSEVEGLKASNARLKNQAEASAVLKEENVGLKRKVESNAMLLEQVVALEQEQDRVTAELESWNQFLSSSESITTKYEAEAALTVSDLEVAVPELPAAPSPLSRSNLPIYVSSLRGLVSGLSTRCHILATKFESSRSSVQALEEEAQSMRDELKVKKTEASQWKTQEQSWRQGKAEWEEEARRYRELLKSYEQEAAAGPSTSVVKCEGPVGEDNDEGMDVDPDSSIVRAASKPHLERISLLERELEAKVRELEQVQTRHEEATLRVKQDLQTEHQELEELRAGIRELQTENAKLDEKLGRAEERLGWGEFNVEKYQCLVLKQNPVDVDRDLRTSTMERLKSENAELVKRVQELGSQLAKAEPSATMLEPSGGDDSDARGLVPASTVDNLRQEIQGLLDSIKLKDKAMLRLKQVYTKKATEFREAVQSLFGFKVRFLENGQVRLKSTFARSSQATSLIFKSDDNDVGQMRLAGEATDESAGLADIAHLREYWLATGMRQSVPCFLAALQLALYESTTQAVRGAWSVPDAAEEEE